MVYPLRAVKKEREKERERASFQGCWHEWIFHPPSHRLSSSAAHSDGIIGHRCSFSFPWPLREQIRTRLHSEFTPRCFEEGQEMNGVVASSEMASLPPLNPSNGPASSRFAAGWPWRPVMMAYWPVYRLGDRAGSKRKSSYFSHVRSIMSALPTLLNTYVNSSRGPWLQTHKARVSFVSEPASRAIASMLHIF